MYMFTQILCGFCYNKCFKVSHRQWHFSLKVRYLRHQIVFMFRQLQLVLQFPILNFKSSRLSLFYVTFSASVQLSYMYEQNTIYKKLLGLVGMHQDLRTKSWSYTAAVSSQSSFSICSVFYVYLCREFEPQICRKADPRCCLLFTPWVMKFWLSLTCMQMSYGNCRSSQNSKCSWLFCTSVF